MRTAGISHILLPSTQECYSVPALCYLVKYFNSSDELKYTGIEPWCWAGNTQDKIQQQWEISSTHKQPLGFGGFSAHWLLGKSRGPSSYSRSPLHSDSPCHFTQCWACRMLVFWTVEEGSLTMLQGHHVFLRGLLGHLCNKLHLGNVRSQEIQWRDPDSITGVDVIN